MRTARATAEIATVYRCGRDALMSRKVRDVKSQGFAFPDFPLVVHSKDSHHVGIKCLCNS